MAKIKDIFDAEVKVQGDFRYFSLSKKHDREQGVKILNEIAEGIKRHVDDVGAVNVHIPWVCEFCGYPWEEDEGGVPECCMEAQEEFKKNAAA